MASVDCEGKTVREINRAIKALIQAGETEVRVLNPAARHSLGVGLTQPETARPPPSAAGRWSCAATSRPGPASR